MDTCM